MGAASRPPRGEDDVDRTQCVVGDGLRVPTAVFVATAITCLVAATALVAVRLAGREVNGDATVTPLPSGAESLWSRPVPAAGTVRPLRENGRVASDELFAGRELAADLATNRKQVPDTLHAWDPDGFLSLPDTDTVTDLIGVGAVECPELHRDKACLDGEPTEAIRDSVNMFRERVKQRVTRTPCASRIPVTQPRST
jgi:hypothetical protein